MQVTISSMTLTILLVAGASTVGLPTLADSGCEEFLRIIDLAPTDFDAVKGERSRPSSPRFRATANVLDFERCTVSDSYYCFRNHQGIETARADGKRLLARVEQCLASRPHRLEPHPANADRRTLFVATQSNSWDAAVSVSSRCSERPESRGKCYVHLEIEKE